MRDTEHSAFRGTLGKVREEVSCFSVRLEPSA